MDLNEEKELIKLAQKDPEVFAKLYDEYYPKIFGYILKRVANLETAQDITSETFFKALLPNMKPSILSAVVLTFVHTIGEFGVVLMIGGNIPGVTKVASIAIFDASMALNYKLANFYSLVLSSVSLSVLILVFFLNKKFLLNDRN